MASHYPEKVNTPFPPPTIDTSTGLEVFDKAESEINSHFTWLHQLLNDRNRAILDKLGEKRAEFVELEAAKVGQIEEIETMKQQLLNSGVKSNESNLLRDKTLTGYDAAIDDLKRHIQPEKIIFENFADKLRTLISSMDLKFIEKDHNDRNNPILSIHRDSIIQSINTFNQPESPKGWGWGWGRSNTNEKKEIRNVILSKLAFDSKTNRVFILNGESNNILVFQQDGTPIACLGEEFKHLTDICIDTNSKLFYVLDNAHCVYKFDLITYQLVKKKEIRLNETQNVMTCLDVYSDEIYVATFQGVSVFNSELEHIRFISILSLIFLIDILCRDEDILTYSIFPNELNIYSYNGDLIRKIPLSFAMGIKHLGEFKNGVSFQFDIDKNGLLLFTNPFENCLHFQTFGGHLVHKIDILPQEDTTFISGVVCTKEGRIFVSVANSEYPLRCY